MLEKYINKIFYKLSSLLLPSTTPKKLGWDIFPEIKTIYIGTCLWNCKWDAFVEAGYYERAHTHLDGIVCVRKKYELFKPLTTEPSDCMWHEYAHVLTLPTASDDGHGYLWAKALYDLNKYEVALNYYNDHRMQAPLTFTIKDIYL